MTDTDETIRLWRTDEQGTRRLTELRRSMFSDDDSFQQAIEFHEERGCVREDNYPNHKENNMTEPLDFNAFQATRQEKTFTSADEWAKYHFGLKEGESVTLLYYAGDLWIQKLDNGYKLSLGSEHEESDNLRDLEVELYMKRYIHFVAGVMTFEQFQATRKEKIADKEWCENFLGTDLSEAKVFLYDETCHIQDLRDGRFELVICNEDWVSEDLGELERILYDQWWLPETIGEVPERTSKKPKKSNKR